MERTTEHRGPRLWAGHSDSGFPGVPLKNRVSMFYMCRSKSHLMFGVQRTDNGRQMLIHTHMLLYILHLLFRDELSSKSYHRLLKGKAGPCPCGQNWCMLLLDLNPQSSFKHTFLYPHGRTQGFWDGTHMDGRRWNSWATLFRSHSACFRLQWEPNRWYSIQQLMLFMLNDTKLMASCSHPITEPEKCDPLYTLNF